MKMAPIDQGALTLIHRCDALLGEGPVWVEAENAFYWLDIKAPLIWRWQWPDGEPTHFTPPFSIASLAPRAGGGFVAGSEKGFALINPERADYEVIANPELDRPQNRFNDGKLDPFGRFWAGTMDDGEQEASGALYRLESDLQWRRIDDGYRVTNGPAFSPDGAQMYHADSARQIVYRFDLDRAGDVIERREFLRFGEGHGYPDGMTVDAEGNLWIAFWDGWCVRRFSPRGEQLETLEVPVQRPTSCTFGGPGLDYLLITSARVGLNEAELETQPFAGGVFMTRVAVGGTPLCPFPG